MGVILVRLYINHWCTLTVQKKKKIRQNGTFALLLDEMGLDEMGLDKMALNQFSIAF